MKRCPVCRAVITRAYRVPVMPELDPYDYEDDFCYAYEPVSYLEFCSRECAECHLAMEEANRLYGGVGSGDASEPAGPAAEPAPAAAA